MPTKPVPLPSKEYLNECFDCNPDTGKLTWKHRPDSHFKGPGSASMMNKRVAGKIAGSPRVSHDGFKGVVVGIGGQAFLVHRIILRMMGVEIPDDMVVDHINGDGWDNRMSNLRVCTQQHNCFNTKSKRGSFSPLKGVSWDRERKKWRADIKVGDTLKCLGRFDTKGLAALVYAKASLRYHGQYGKIKNNTQWQGRTSI